MEEDIRNSINKILMQSLEITEEELCKKFENGVELDSFEIIEFLFRIEEKYEIEYDDFAELSLHMNSINEMIDFIAKYVLLEEKKHEKYV